MAGIPRNVFLSVAVLLTSLIAAGSVRAETLRPAQSVAANALPLIHLPAPANPASVCLVDTGVDLTPDTRGSVVARLSQNSSIDVGDGSPDKHGTRMASVIAAPANGWGMVGAWPAAKIVSSRGVGDTTGGITTGILRCLEERPSYNTKVIEIAAGYPGVRPGQSRPLQGRVDQAKAAGMNVVAAAGNDGGELDAPANFPGVFAVSAINKNGYLCREPDGSGGAATGPELDLVTLGCGLDLAHPNGQPMRGGGTSEASAFVAAVLTALRSYRPDLTATQAEQILTNTATPTPGGPALNVAAAFHAAGLTPQWNQAARHVPPPPTPPQPTGTGAPPTEVQPVTPTPATNPYRGKQQRRYKLKTRHGKRAWLPRPKIRVKRTGNRLQIKAANRPRNSVLVITIKVGGKVRTLKLVRRNAATVRLPRGKHITIRYRIRKQRSPTRTIKSYS